MVYNDKMINSLILMQILALTSIHSNPIDLWKPEVFDYKRPSHLDITEEEISYEQLLEGGKYPMVEIMRGIWKTQAPSPQNNYLVKLLNFKNFKGEVIPCILTIPKKGKGPYPVILLAHGFTSNKEQFTYWLSGELADKGFASLSLDLPFHGHRKGNPAEIQANGNIDNFYKNMVQGVTDIRQLIDLAETRKELDTSKGVGAAGYSMGSGLMALAGARDSRIKFMVLMVEGSMRITSSNFEETVQVFGNLDCRKPLWEKYSTIRSEVALPHFSPRPVLFLNGKRDRLIPPEASKIIHDATPGPKEILWYESGHILPPQAFYDASQWIEKQWEQLRQKEAKK